MTNIVYIKKYFTEKFDHFVDRIDYLKINKYACTNRSIFYTDGHQSFSKITDRVINIHDFSYIIFVNRLDRNSHPRFIIKLRDLKNYKDAENKVEELIEFYTSERTEREMAVIWMEFDYWLTTLNDAMKQGDEKNIQEAKLRLKGLHQRATAIEMF